MAHPRVRVPGCGRGDDPSEHDRRTGGQALVELALIFPVLMLMLGAAIDGGRLMLETAQQQRNTGVVADWSASRPGEDWHAISNELLPGCDVTVAEDPGKPGLLTAGSRCTFVPLVLRFWDGLPISSEASAVLEEPDPTPTPSPEGSAS